MNIHEEVVILETPAEVSVIVPKPKKAKKAKSKSKGKSKKAFAKTSKRAPKKENLAKTKRKSGKRGPQGRPEEEKIRNGSKKFGARLRAKRKELGWTQAQMGELLGIKQPHMCNLEKGTFPPGPKLAGIIEKKFFKHVGIRPRRAPPKL